MTLDERIAKALGWQPQDVHRFSRHTIRALLRQLAHAQLAAEVGREIQSGRYILGENNE